MPSFKALGLLFQAKTIHYKEIITISIEDLIVFHLIVCFVSYLATELHSVRA